jgi:putative SOS response-associated peptidase YedK
MCGRYTTAADRVKFDDIFKPAAVEQAVEKAVGRYNVAPTQQVAIIERTAEDDRHASTALLVAGAMVGEKHQGKTAVDKTPVRTRS